MHDLLRTNIPRQDIAGPNGAAGELIGIGEGGDDEASMKDQVRFFEQYL